jgi:spore maturation protein CgeB
VTPIDRLSLMPSLRDCSRRSTEPGGTVSSAGVVLNDHWPEMRDWGFVSNRIFDVAACGTPVVSDHLPEITDLFRGAVLTYSTPDTLQTAVDEATSDGDAARTLTRHARELVLANHTFDHRARALVQSIVEVSHGGAA